MYTFVVKSNFEAAVILSSKPIRLLMVILDRLTMALTKSDATGKVSTNAISMDFALIAMKEQRGGFSNEGRALTFCRSC